jgi:hypothetical protein
MGVRYDYQRVGYSAATRVPQISDVTTALQAGDGGRIFPATSNIAAGTFLKNNNVSPRLGFSYNLDGVGKTVLKGFYGRYYNNLADGFSGVNPGGQSYVEYNFNDLNHNGKYDGVQELGTFRTRIGGVTTFVDPNSKTPYTDEFSATIEHQLWGESSVRGTYVRKMQKQFLPFYFTPMVQAWMTATGNNLNVPVRGTYNGQTYNLLDVSNSLANLTGDEYTNYPDGNFTYDTIELAFHKRAGKLFFQASGDYQWRNELRTADPNETATSPLSTDPIAVFPQLSINPNAPNRQKTTMYHLQASGRYEFKGDVGVAVNYRFQSGFPYSPIVPDGAVTINAAGDNPNVCNFGCAFFEQNLSQNRSESVNLMNFRIDKAIRIRGSMKAMVMLDIYNLLNADPVTNFNLNDAPGYKNVIAVLDPRVFQIGFRFEF